MLRAKFLVDIEVENVGDLEIGSIDQDQIATDHEVRVVRRRRRKHDFKFSRTGLHLSLKPRRQGSTNH